MSEELVSDDVDFYLSVAEDYIKDAINGAEGVCNAENAFDVVTNIKNAVESLNSIPSEMRSEEYDKAVVKLNEVLYNCAKKYLGKVTVSGSEEIESNLSNARWVIELGDTAEEVLKSGDMLKIEEGGKYRRAIDIYNRACEKYGDGLSESIFINI